MTDDSSLPVRLLFHDDLVGALHRQESFGSELRSQDRVGLLHLLIAGAAPLDVDEAVWFQPDPQSCVVLLHGESQRAEEIAARSGVTGAGLAHYPRAAGDPDRLMAAAAKAAEDARTWGGGLRRAPSRPLSGADPGPLDLDRLGLFYQPQIDVGDGQIIGVEALVRVLDAEQGFTSPQEVISAAEDKGTMAEIGEWALENACAQVAAWRRDAGHEIDLAVNVSLSQFASNVSVERLARIVSNSDLDPCRIELELTESVAPGDLGDINAHLARLRELGVRLALDDLGTGYASLSLLRALHLDKVKIDRSFIANLGTPPPAGPVAARELGAIITWARRQDLIVLVEGVERAEQFELLRRLHCDSCQGFYFSPPVPGEAMALLLAA